MEVDNLSYSNSKNLKSHSRLKSDFKARHKHFQLDEYKQSLSIPQHPLRHPSFDKSFSMPLSKPNHSPAPSIKTDIQLAHYNSLSTFKEKLLTPISKPTPEKIQRKTPIISPIRYERSSEIWHQLSLNAICKAREIVKHSGVTGVTWTYKRQLRQFCLEVLKNIEI